MLIVPEDFASATIAREGEAAHNWIQDLPHLVRDLCKEWDLVLDGSAMHGYLGLAIPVRHGDEPYMLKISWIDEATAAEATALAVWNGQGAVQLLKAEPSRGALLLERLDHRRTLQTVKIGEAVLVAGRLLRRLAIPAPVELRSLRATAEEIAQSLPERWARYGCPMPRRVLDQARDFAIQLGAPTQAVLVNYDLHYADILAGEREPWLAVDPKVVIGDLEFGVAQLLWCRLEDMESHGGLNLHFHRLIEVAELDPQLAHAWTLVRCVDYWLWGLSVGLTEDPARCARIIERLSAPLLS